MPRRSYKKLKTDIDPVYESYEVAKLVNYLMIDGKKSVARRVVYDALEKLKSVDPDPLKALLRAIGNVAPQMEVKARRLGGASYMVPQEVRRERRLFLALNWILEGARARSSKEYRTFTDKLVAELKDAINGVGSAFTKKQNIEKQADQNKAFAHLKW